MKILYVLYRELFHILMFQYCELQKIVMGKYNNVEALWKRLDKTIFIDVILVVYHRLAFLSD